MPFGETALNLNCQVRLDLKRLHRCNHLNWMNWKAGALLVAVDVDGFDDDFVDVWAGAKVGVGDDAAERKKDNVGAVVAAVVV